MTREQELQAAGEQLREQIEQMRGMFDDSDGAIQRALDDWEDACRDAPPSRVMQCKDIPDRPILEMLAKNPKQWHTWYDGKWNVREAMPPDTPPKLVLAKMRMMIRRGVVDGCPCGCRGDFVITEKGLAEISHDSKTIEHKL